MFTKKFSSSFFKLAIAAGSIGLVLCLYLSIARFRYNERVSSFLNEVPGMSFDSVRNAADIRELKYFYCYVVDDRGGYLHFVLLGSEKIRIRFSRGDEMFDIMKNYNTVWSVNNSRNPPSPGEEDK